MSERIETRQTAAAAVARLRRRAEDLAAAVPRMPALFLHRVHPRLLAGCGQRNPWRCVVIGPYGSGGDERPLRALYVPDKARIADLADVLRWFGVLLPELPHPAIGPKTLATRNVGRWPETLRGACALLDLAMASKRPNLSAHGWRWHTLEASKPKRIPADVLEDCYANPAALWRVELPSVYRTLAEALDELESTEAPAAPAAAAADALDAIDADAMLAPARLAAIAGVPAEALRSRLRRWREKNLDGWVQNSERGAREAEYLYRVGAVRPVVEELRATTGATGERPASGK